MKRFIYTLVAVLALILIASCGMPDENTSLEGTWVGESAIRILTLKFFFS